MPTYDVTFKVGYEQTLRVDADDADTACEIVGDSIKDRVPDGARRVDVGYYSCEVARKDDDA